MAINSVQKAQRNTFLKFIIYISYMQTLTLHYLLETTGYVLFEKP